MISLQLNDGSPLRVSIGVSIAAPRLFEVSRQLFHVEVLWKASDSSQTLASITLLEMQMNEVGGGCLSTLLLLRSFLSGSRVVNLISGRDDQLLVLGLGIRVIQVEGFSF